MGRITLKYVFREEVPLWVPSALEVSVTKARRQKQSEVHHQDPIKDVPILLSRVSSGLDDLGET